MHSIDSIKYDENTIKTEPEFKKKTFTNVIGFFKRF